MHLEKQSVADLPAEGAGASAARLKMKRGRKRGGTAGLGYRRELTGPNVKPVAPYLLVIAWTKSARSPDAMSIAACSSGEAHKGVDRCACLAMYTSRPEIINLTLQERLLSPSGVSQYQPAVYRQTNRSRHWFGLIDASDKYHWIYFDGGSNL
jgi:hypothetical protein